MNWIHHISSIANPFEMAFFYFSHVLGGQVQLIFIDVILILALHGFYILLIMRLFKRFIANTAVSQRLLSSFLLYFFAILLVIVAHLDDIILLSLVMDALKVFPDPLTTFYYVSGMYTTIGSNANPGPEWQSLSMIISFAGLFAFAISGAGLYSMLGFFLSPQNNDHKKS